MQGSLPRIMFTPALCGDSGKTATLDTKQNIRKMSSGKRKRSKSVEDILDGDASVSGCLASLTV